MRRKLGALVLLGWIGFCTAAPAQSPSTVPLPVAQGANEKSLVAKAQIALDAKRWPEAEAALKQVMTSEPRWEYSGALGDAQINQGHYEESVASYQRAIDMAQNKASPAAIGRIYTMMGNANLKLKRNDAAIAAYDKAAPLLPNPAVGYFNVCAVMYNMGQTAPKTMAACDKAIAADPKKADAYFIKGSVLMGEGKPDKNNKIVVPPGTVEALRQYLALAPDGAHAKDVKDMLDFPK
jgi:tetratricopeptide (TPR) repeat protein